MTDRFKNIIIPFIFKWEGTTYENDPDDPGGATKYGIDQRSHPHINIKNLTVSEATDIYWNEWITDGCTHIPQPLDWVFFNACVNCGMARASAWMRDSGRNASKFLDLQEDFYKELARRRPTSRKFLNGWLARTEDLRRAALG